MDRELVTGDAENLEHECIEGTTHASSTAPTTRNTSTDIDMTEQIDINNQVQEQEVQPAALTDNASVTSPSHEHVEDVNDVTALNNEDSNNDEAEDTEAQDRVENDDDDGHEEPQQQDEDAVPPIALAAELHDTRGGRRSSNRCPICISEPDVQHIDLSCGCRWCIDCLNSYFTSSLQNRSTFPPRCDRDTLEFGEIGGFLNDANVVRFFDVAEEYGAARPVFCANKECANIDQAGASKFLGDAAVLTFEIGTPLLLTCLECGVRTCATCRLLSDDHTTDDGLRCPENAEVEDLKKVVDDMGLPPTQCPSCAHLCERSEGCPVLTCVCGTKFCYICGQQAGDDERRECECADSVAPGWNGQQEEDWDSDDEEEDM